MLDLPAIESEARALAPTDARMSETLLALCARVEELEDAMLRICKATGRNAKPGIKLDAIRVISTRALEAPDANR